MKAVRSQQIRIMLTEIFLVFVGAGPLLPNADALRLNISDAYQTASSAIAAG